VTSINQQQILKDVRGIHDDLMEVLRNDPAKIHLIVNKTGG
jgi:hypothetical protein